MLCVQQAAIIAWDKYHTPLQATRRDAERRAAESNPPLGHNYQIHSIL